MSRSTKARNQSRTATHRPAKRHRRFRHDEYTAVDLFSGFGGITNGIKRAGFTAIMAANHDEYKIDVHEANHPEAEHWIADLVDPDSADYHDARDLPAADLVAAGVSCVNHSHANTQKAYAQGLSLFDLHDPEFEARVTRSERDRATANCVLHYAAKHHPRLILVECTTELTSWGPAIPGRPKVGDGSTFRWWLKQFENLRYRYKILYLNSMFFGVPQSRNRLYIAMWDKSLPDPDLEHRPESWCDRCQTIVQAVWSWKTGIPATGSVSYGKQYNYRCPSCRREVFPPACPSLYALDLTNLGTRIGDRAKPLRPKTMARAERCRQRFADFPAVLMPTKAMRGTEKHPWQPMATQTSQQEVAILSTGALICRSRGLDQPLWAQTATNSTGLLTPPVAVDVPAETSAPHPATLATGAVFAAHRHNGDGKHITQPMDTVTSTHEKAVLLAAIDNYQGSPRGVDQPLPTQVGSETLGFLTAAGVVPFRKHTVPTVHGEPMPTVTSDQIPGLLAAGWFKQNSTNAADFPAPHPLADPLGTLTARDTTALLSAEWRAALAELALEDCYFRMLGPHEVGRGCGFDVDFPNHKGSFVVWGSARDQVDGFGNAVSPSVGTWIGERLRAVLHREVAV